MKFSPKSTNGILAPHRYICFVSNIVTILTKLEIIVILILGLSDSPFLSKEFSDFLMPMLEFDPKERVTAEEALQLPFFKDI